MGILVEIPKANKYYIGSTENIDQRLKDHFAGFSPATKALGVAELLLKQEYGSLKAARFVESKLKRLKRKDYIEKIIKDGYIRLSPP